MNKQTLWMFNVSFLDLLDISFFVLLLNIYKMYTTYNLQDNNLYTKILFQLFTQQTKCNKYRDTRRITSKLMIMSFVAFIYRKTNTEKWCTVHTVQLAMLFSFQLWIAHLHFAYTLYVIWNATHCIRVQRISFCLLPTQQINNQNVKSTILHI